MGLLLDRAAEGEGEGQDDELRFVITGEREPASIDDANPGSNPPVERSDDAAQ